MRRLLMIGAVLVASAAMTAPANAEVLSVGESFDVTFFKDCSPAIPGCDTDLKGELTLTLTGITDGTATFLVELTNTSADLGGGQPKILAVGFATSPDATGISGDTDAFGGVNEDGVGDGNVFDDFSLASVNGPNGIPSLKLVEICAYAANNCTGGAIGDGLAAQTSDTFQIVLTGAFVAGGTVTVSDFGVKFQGAPDSFEFYGDGVPEDGVPADGPPQEAEPTTLLLLGAGFAMAASRMRRQSA